MIPPVLGDYMKDQENAELEMTGVEEIEDQMDMSPMSIREGVIP